jgi:hypothetical protein
VAAQLLQQHLAFRRGIGIGFQVAGRQRIGHAGQVVAARQQQHDHLVVEHHAAVAHLVQQALHHVGKGDDVVKAEQARRALDGVRGAEDGVDRFALVAGDVDVEQAFSISSSSSRLSVINVCSASSRFMAFPSEINRVSARRRQRRRPGPAFQRFPPRRGCAAAAAVRAVGGCSLLGQHQHLQAGGIELGDARQIDLQHARLAQASSTTCFKSAAR